MQHGPRMGWLLRNKADAELIMNHSEAIKLQAVERYLLGELTGEQRDRFEEHYFGCAECATDLKAAAGLVGNARELLKTEFALEEKAESTRKHFLWSPWFRPAYAMAAVSLLLAVLVYQNLVSMPRLRRQLAEVSTPQALASYSLINSTSRAAGFLTIRTPFNRAFGLYVDIPPGPFTQYVCEIRDTADRVKFSVGVSAEQAKETVQLLVPPSQLPPGRYVLLVRGAGSAPAGQNEVARFPFALE